MIRKPLATTPAKSGREPLWKSFIKAITLLAVSLAAALYSTGASRAGDVPATIIASVAALLIAVWVAIRFVPRLAQGVDWAWMPTTRYKVTTEGGIFFGAIFVVLAAALNTSNNLLYMVLSALLAVLLLSGFLSTINFKSLELELLIPAKAFAGQALPVSVRLRNRRRLFPAFSLRAESPGKGLYFPLIQPRATLLRKGEALFPRRGRYEFSKLKVVSGFPFGFFAKAREFPVDATCVCYPEISAQEQLDISIADILGALQRPERGRGIDLHTIRDYIPSDSARHIHWKASAKTGVLKTREFAGEDNPRAVVVFDRYGNPGDPSDVVQFEALVSRTASLAYHLMGNGVGVKFISDTWESSVETSGEALDRILNYLALVEMSPAAEAPRFEPSAGMFLSLRDGRDGRYTRS